MLLDLKGLADYLRGFHFGVASLAPLPGAHGDLHREAGARRDFREDQFVSHDDGRAGNYKEMYGQSGVAAGKERNGGGSGGDIGYFLKCNILGDAFVMAVATDLAGLYDSTNSGRTRMADGQVDGGRPGAIQGQAEPVVAEGFHAAAKPFDVRIARGPGQRFGRPDKIRGQPIQQPALQGKGDTVRFRFERRGDQAIGQRSGGFIKGYPGDAIECIGKSLAVFVGKGGELGGGVPVDAGDGLGFLGGGVVKIPRECAILRRGLGIGEDRPVFMAGNGQVGQKAGG